MPTRRQFLIGGAAAMAATSLSFPALAAPRLWRVYGGDPHSRTRSEAIGKLAETLATFRTRGVNIPATVVEQLLHDVHTGGRSKFVTVRSGEEFLALTTGSEFWTSGVAAAWRNITRARAEVWEVQHDGQTHRLLLFLEGRHDGSDEVVVDTCFNWAIQLERAGDCFDFFLETIGENGGYMTKPVVLTWHFWRTNMTAAELLADPCFCALDHLKSTCTKPEPGCVPCEPGWDFAGRGEPDHSWNMPVIGSGYLRIPRRLLEMSSGRGSEVLICSYDERFASPDNRGNIREGYGFTSADVAPYWHLSGTPRTQAIDFRKRV